MKKAGLLTTHRAINYGAVLQAFALSYVLNSYENVKCDIIDYDPKLSTYGRKTRYKFGSIKDFAYSILLFLNKNYRNRQKEKVSKFDQFVKYRLPLSNKKFTTITEVEKEIDKYDFLLCGSDQIWNLNLMNEPTFFLDFKNVKSNYKKIAYAPSITEKMSKEQLNVIKDRIKDFNYLSMREKESAERFTKIIGREVKNVLDPIFLLTKDEWSQISTKPENINVNKPFILSYGLVSNPIFGESIKFVKQKKGLMHIDLQVRPFNKYDADVCVNNLSPENFVWLFLNADFICTSSFHGTSFSILFNKEFITIPAQDRSSRIENILDITGLTARYIRSAKDLSEDLMEKIDYTQSNKLLNKQIKYSRDYLDQSMKIEN